MLIARCANHGSSRDSRVAQQLALIQFMNKFTEVAVCVIIVVIVATTQPALFCREMLTVHTRKQSIVELSTGPDALRTSQEVLLLKKNLT